MVVHPRPLGSNLGAVDPCGQRAAVGLPVVLRRAGNVSTRVVDGC